MNSSTTFSKRTFKFHLLGHVLFATVIACLVFVPFNGNSSLDVISNVLSSTKINSFLIILFHLTFQVILRNVSGSDLPYRLSFKDGIRAIFHCIASILVFHFIAVMFGAAFTENSAETFHLALLLTCTTVIPSFIHIGISSDSWIKVFAQNSPEPGTESMVYYASLFSAIGTWIGALPIPLDWDRPWQIWPVSCVFGALIGHCFGLLLNSVYIFVFYYKTNKFKFT